MFFTPISDLPTFTLQAPAPKLQNAKLTHSFRTGNTAQPKVTDLGPVDLQTPCIKGEVYTTGRGGKGNMVKNTDPDEARRAQDVTM